MGRASRRKKIKQSPSPAKISKGFAPLPKPDNSWEDDYWNWDEPYNETMEDNPFMGFIRIPEKPAVNLPDNELYAACVCDGEIESQSIWLTVFQGGLEDCISCLATVINLKEDEDLQKLKLGLNPKEWGARRDAYFQSIRQECIEKGAAKVEFYWFITSKRKNPHFFDEKIAAIVPVETITT